MQFTGFLTIASLIVQALGLALPILSLPLVDIDNVAKAKLLFDVDSLASSNNWYSALPTALLLLLNMIYLY
ncbi:hypothetical protein F5884DRAFT_805870 [Xylogone sp. PMI_703]|nr:hypothetical protein F5884DRAFT_805870 [Xylogone sp. PMI_703]